MGAQTAKTSPPAGSGHVPGFGESFNINLNTGQGVYSYKIALPDGVAGHTPGLTLEYSSSHTYGNFGWGWDMGIRKISRKLDVGQYEDQPTEMLLDSGAEIVPMPDGTYRARFETVYNRYKKEGEGWSIEEKSGIKHTLGTAATHRIQDPEHPDRIYCWLLEKTTDACGNEIKYTYLIDDNTYYLESVQYASYLVRFAYEGRPDVRVNGKMGFLSKRSKRCNGIALLMKEGNDFVPLKTWKFNFRQDALTEVSLLSSIQLKSHGEDVNGAGDVEMPEVKFSYNNFDAEHYQVQFIKNNGRSNPPPLTEEDASLINMGNNPLPGILSNYNGKQFYWENDGKGGWQGPLPVNKTPFVSSFAQEGAVFGDLNGSGTADMMVVGPNALKGYYENTGKHDWGQFIAYPRARNAFPALSESTRFLDANGNGVVDAIQSTPRGFTVWKNQKQRGWDPPTLSVKKSKDISQVSFEDKHCYLADMTGDGLLDIVKIGSGRIDYWPSLGNGKYGDKITLQNAPKLYRLSEYLDQTFLADISGSGCADLITVSDKGISVFYNQNGTSFSEEKLFDLIPAPLAGSMRTIDFYGNGHTGLLYNTRKQNETAYVYVSFGNPTPAYTLNKVENGFGLVSEIFYQPAIQYYLQDLIAGNKWQTNFPFPLQVVEGMKETDVITGNVIESVIHYHNAHFNGDLRQFQGFGMVEKIEKGDESCPDKRTVYTYLMGQEYAEGNREEHAALNGKLESVKVYALDGSAEQDKPYTIEASEYMLAEVEEANDGIKRVAVQLDMYRQMHVERSNDKRVEEKKYQYDVFGNLKHEALTATGEENGQPVPSIASEIDYQYAINETQWILDKVARVVVKDKDGNVTGETQKFYDGPEFVGLPLGEVSKGLEVREVRMVMQKTAFMNHYNGMDITQLGYFEAADGGGVPSIFLNFKRSKFDARGLRIGEMDALGNQVTIHFDTEGLFKESYESTLGINAYEINRKLGVATRVTGPDGAVVRMQYDSMGRLTDVFTPDNASNIPSHSYGFDNSQFPFKRTTRFYPKALENESYKVVTYFDGNSKEIQNRLECEDGNFTVSEYQVMNPFGKNKIEHQPFYADSEDFSIPDLATHPHQCFTFDVMGRPLSTTNFLGGISTATYRVFEVITTDAIDNETDPALVNSGVTNTPKIERFNVLRDRTETIHQVENNEQTGLKYQLSDYGQLNAIEDEQGIVATYVYDYQGNRLVVNHREGGTRKVWYNALKQPVKGEDANGNIISAEHDALNRITKMIANGQEVETYVYDTPASNAIGRLAEVTYPKGKESFLYDDVGRIIEKSYSFDDRNDPIAIKFGYDRLGRRSQIEYDDGTQINYSYTPNGWVKAIDGIVNNIEYDPMGNPVVIRYANDVVTTATFIEGGRKVKTQKTVNKQNQVLEDLTYAYLANGSLQKLTDATGNQPMERSYAYNALDEIIRCNETQNAQTETYTYAYADHFNLKTMGETGSQLLRETPGHPARISKMIGSNAEETVLSYDDNGNLLNLPGRTFTYNYKNAITKVVNDDGLQGEYFYNHREQRVEKIVIQGNLKSTTYFIDNLAEYKDTQKAYFIYLGNIRVGMIKDGVTTFIHTNYLGNTSFYSDPNGNKLASIAYKPFGNIKTADNGITHWTFGTHPFDEESGLYYMGKRYYAQETGCFMSPDPVALFLPKKVINSIKAFQPYAYTGNDPANNVDLTGLSFWSVLGAVVGAVVGIALVVFAGPLAALIIGIGIITLSYILAANNVNNDFGEFMRGFMIGFNAGMNAAIGTILFGPVIGTALGVISFLAAFDSVAQNEVYKGILGWASWFMPMSWIVTGLGLVFFVINLIVAGVTFQQVDRVKINSISVNWQMGMIVMEGGLITNTGGGFNMGNFSFVGEGHAGVTDHELGHGLNLGAYGWVFHFVGAIDENLVQENSWDAYSEHLAESNQATPDHTPPSPSLDMWTA